MPPSSDPGDWFDRPMRWAQLTLVENDPGRYDPGFWLDYFRRIHADAACLSAGGCVAYYPTQIPLHHRSAWMGESDPFGDLVRGCRALDMVVIARTDPHAVLQEAHDAHPDWVAVDAEGQPRRHWASPHRWVTCALGPYNWEFMTAVHREIVSMYGVDGIFSNRWAGHGICYCEHCRRDFAAAYGMELPHVRDPHDPAYRSYLLWRQQRLFDLWLHWDAAIREINPAARYIPNSGGGALSSLDMARIGALSDILFADRQARSGLMPPWAAGQNAKEYRATMGKKPVGGIFSVGVEEPYRWKDSVQSAAEIRIWAHDGIANGLRPWFTKFGGVLYDTRWLDVVHEIYAWHHRWERYLRNERPLARVAIVYSQQTAAYYRGEQARARVQDHILGVYQALIEARVPFEMVHDRLLDADHLAPFKTLILPNVAALSDGQCAQLRAFVAGGGSLIATLETSLYDEWGERRETFGLADLFGVDAAGPVEGPVHNAYLNVERDPQTGAHHPLLSGLESAGRVIGGVYWQPVQARQAPSDVPLTLVPAYPDLPMEEVYPRQPHTAIPGVYLRQAGAGRIVYWPWDIDRTFWEVVSPDHGLLLYHAVSWATGEPQPVTVIGPGLLDVTIWQQSDSLTVHLVNLTNPMTMKGPFRETCPVGAQQVQIRLPDDSPIRRVHLLGLDRAPEYTVQERVLTVLVPGVHDHEVVAVDL